MEDVNSNIIAPKKLARTGGKKKLPLDKRRVILSTRILPATKAWLDGFGCVNAGRAIDKLATTLHLSSTKKELS